ncbi:hypothetical protein GII30_05845 [Gordonia amarae]|nr:hypothetical protein [Gordonia amarae]MCS3877890.1 hypothetical protein [Gordonia amarae]QHN16607.1 hypothetical protein GII35_06070 [Gordonia amarae]QHN21132.1 hypothetical protein GII34_05850 [Gordonia amarae]QHN29985.1 hypothetical protein GII32_05860 [Gordonia amarae]QHN38760.1 hypothetical protein GII30_05845 [Gordonia amarae]
MHSESTERSQRTPVGLITAGVVFAIGIVAVVVLFLTPVVADGSTAPTFVYLLTMCAPLGFVLGLIFAFRSAREIR